MKRRLRNVRFRLTFWYVGVFALVFVLYICAASLLQFRQLNNQLYTDEVQDMETVEGLLYFAPDGRLVLDEKYHNHPQSRLLLYRLMQVETPRGRLLYRNQRLGDRTLGGKPFAKEGLSSYDRRNDRLEDGTRVLLISHIHWIDGQPLLIRLAYSREPVLRQLSEFIVLLLLALPIPLILAGFVGYRMVCQTLKPLGEMVRRTEQITAASLHERLPTDIPEDELGQMAGVLNGLFQRLEDSFEHLKRFTSDASHELRTLLASIRSVGEVSLQREHTREEYRDVIGSMLEEVGRLTRMVEALLAMAKADAGQIELKTTTFPVMDMVREVVSLLGVLAEDKKQLIQVEGDVEGGAPVLVEADRMILERALMNLVENAIKYSPQGSSLYLSVQALPDKGKGQWMEIIVEDEGPGIPDHIRGKVFERFFRFEEKHSREAGGSGLGLAIAKWAVEVNGGSISLRPSRRGGCLFSIRLPQARGAPVRANVSLPHEAWPAS